MHPAEVLSVTIVDSSGLVDVAADVVASLPIGWDRCDESAATVTKDEDDDSSRGVGVDAMEAASRRRQTTDTTRMIIDTPRGVSTGQQRVRMSNKYHTDTRRIQTCRIRPLATNSMREDFSIVVDRLPWGK